MRRVQPILTAGDYPDCLLFEERDGLYWVSQSDMKRLQTLSLPAAVARAVSGIRVSAAADKGCNRHPTRPA